VPPIKNKLNQNANGELRFSVHWHDLATTYHPTLRAAMLNVWDRDSRKAIKIITPEGELSIREDIFNANSI